jgi:hypothetical protein
MLMAAILLLGLISCELLPVARVVIATETGREWKDGRSSAMPARPDHARGRQLVAPAAHRLY